MGVNSARQFRKEGGADKPNEWLSLIQNEGVVIEMRVGDGEPMYAGYKDGEIYVATDGAEKGRTLESMDWEEVCLSEHIKACVKKEVAGELRAGVEPRDPAHTPLAHLFTDRPD